MNKSQQILGICESLQNINERGTTAEAAFEEMLSMELGRRDVVKYWWMNGDLGPKFSVEDARKLVNQLNQSYKPGTLYSGPQGYVDIANGYRDAFSIEYAGGQFKLNQV